MELFFHMFSDAEARFSIYGIQFQNSKVDLKSIVFA